MTTSFLIPSLLSSDFISGSAHPHGQPGVGVREWTVEQVVAWLSSESLSQYAPIFAAHRITGDVILGLTRADLESMLSGAQIKNAAVAAVSLLVKVNKLKPLAKAHADFLQLACKDDDLHEEAEHLHTLNAYRLTGASSVTEIPVGFLCPLTGELLNNPVTASDGSTYERFAIEAWLKVHGTLMEAAEWQPCEERELNV